MPILLLAEFLRSSSTAQHHSKVAFLFHGHGFRIKSGVLKRFIRGSNGQRHRARDMFAFASFDPGEFVEVGDFTRDLHRQIAHIKARDALHSAFPRKNRAAECILSDSVWAYDAHTCDNSALSHQLGPLSRLYAEG